MRRWEEATGTDLAPYAEKAWDRLLDLAEAGILPDMDA